jgi:hypothetical protein
MKKPTSAYRRLLCLACAAIGVLPAVAQQTFDGNSLYDNLGGSCRPASNLTMDACELAFQFFANNDSLVNPMLGDPYNRLHPNWLPTQIPTEWTMVRVDSRTVECFTCPGGCDYALPQHACYRGAMAPAPVGEGDWTQGWTYYLVDGAGRTDINYSKPLVILQGPQSADVHMTAANNYLVRGKVNMLAGTTLTIDPGVVVFGENATAGYLVIERGARIHAVGTVQQPIILTTDQAPGFMTRGGWGGVVIHGRGVANCANCLAGESCESEGGAGFHCGDNSCDSSGEIKYARVEYAGVEISPDNELNAWTFNSVGCNTKVSYLQSHMGDDDLFEWFGGEMEADHLVGTGGGDDGLDWQMGFRGRIQFAVIQQWDDVGDKGIEADNNEYNYDAPCRSNPTIANVTLIGPHTTAATATFGIHLRRGTDAQIYNSIIMGWRNQGLRVEHQATVNRGVYPSTGAICGSGVDEEIGMNELKASVSPNPASSRTQFSFELPEPGRAQITVHDASGRLVAEVLDRELAAGGHQIPWDLPVDNATGAYFYRIETPGGVATGHVFKITR